MLESGAMEPAASTTSPARSQPRRPRLLRLLRSLALVYGVWCLALFLLQSRMLYLPALAGVPMSEAAVDAVPGLERLWIAQSESTSSDRTEAWLLRAGDPNGSGEPRTLVCFTHGNAELIDQCLAEARAWRDRGFHVLLPEYRGYGRSAGSPSQDDIVRDVDRAVEIALERTGARSIVFHGRSLGTGVAVQVAARHRQRARAIVLESPFTSVTSFAWRYGIPPLLVTNPYRTDELLPTFACPVLILHAQRDEIVPFAHGEALAAMQPLATLMPLDGSHNSGLSSTTAYWSAIDEMLAKVGGETPAASLRPR